MTKRGMQLRTIILVGSTRGKLEDGRIGGQAFACRSLMSSQLASDYLIKVIDSSISSISTSRGLLRAPSAIYRLSIFLWYLLFFRPQGAILFASHGLSFIEKGVMALLASVFGVRVLLMPRSGHLVKQIERSRLFAAFVKFVLLRCDRVICQSAYWRSFFSLVTGGKGNFCVVENWLADEAFVPADADVSSSGNGHFVVGYFNRIEEAKGIFDFIEAVRLASRSNPALRAIVYGDGSSVDDMLARINSAGLGAVIEYKGWLGEEDKIDSLRKLDAYVFCSHAEGFPNSLLEVLALKVPVVSVRVGAVPDVILNGVNGLLADIGDVSTIAEAIDKLAREPEMRMHIADAAYRRVCEENTLKKSVDRIIEALG